MYDSFSSNSIRMPSSSERELIKETIGMFKASSMATLIEHIVQTVFGGFLLFAIVANVAKYTVFAFDIFMYVLMVFAIGYWTYDMIKRYNKSKKSINKLSNGEYKVADGKAHDCALTKTLTCVCDGEINNNYKNTSVLFEINGEFVTAENFNREFLCAITDSEAFVIAKMPDGDILTSNDVDIVNKK